MLFLEIFCRNLLKRNYLIFVFFDMTFTGYFYTWFKISDTVRKQCVIIERLSCFFFNPIFKFNIPLKSILRVIKFSSNILCSTALKTEGLKPVFWCLIKPSIPALRYNVLQFWTLLGSTPANLVSSRPEIPAFSFSSKSAKLSKVD